MKEKEAMEIFEEILKRISQAVGDDITVISINGVRLAKEGEFPCADCEKADPVEEPKKGDKVWAKPLRRLVMYTGATKYVNDVLHFHCSDGESGVWLEREEVIIPCSRSSLEDLQSGLPRLQ